MPAEFESPPGGQVPFSLLSISDLEHILRYLRTWQDLTKYIEARHKFASRIGLCTVGEEVALFGYYTAMKDTFDSCRSLDDAKIVVAAGQHIRDGSAFREQEAGLAFLFEQFMPALSDATESPSLTAEIRLELCGLNIQERAALGKKIGELCGKMDSAEPATYYATIRLGRYPDKIYLAVVLSEPSPELSMVVQDLMLAACSYFRKSSCVALVLEGFSTGSRPSIMFMDHCKPSPEYLEVGNEYFGQRRLSEVSRYR